MPMSPGRRDDPSDPFPGSVPDDAEDEGLLTSEDLFGDLVDAVPEPPIAQTPEARQPHVRSPGCEAGGPRARARGGRPAAAGGWAGPGEAAPVAEMAPPAVEPEAPFPDPVLGLLDDAP